jgi:hypothetical protein
MQFIADIIDQMDLALDQLSVRDRNFDRFALMLIDNAVELTLHRFVQDKANENEMWENGQSRNTILKIFKKHDHKILIKK